MKKAYKAIYYQDPTTGKEPFKKWLDGLKDNTAQVKVMIRIARAEGGNFGDHKSVGQGVSELRIPFGPGYRVYYGIEAGQIILLLVGGDKSSQAKDIEKAKALWSSHKKEKKNG